MINQNPDENQIEGLNALNELNDIMDELLGLVDEIFPNEKEIKQRQIEEEIKQRQIEEEKRELEFSKAIEALKVKEKFNKERITSMKERKFNKKWWEFWI